MSKKLHIFIIILSLFTFHSSLLTSHAKVYIDITAPAIRQLPLTINAKGPEQAKQLKGIVQSDLEFTGIFAFVDPGVPGAEIIVNLDTDTTDGIKVVLSVIDLIENRTVLKKRFSAATGKSIRLIAHSIADDIYNIATEKKGIFRTKLSYLIPKQSSGTKELRIMDWDGHNARKLISKGLTTSHSWAQDGRYLLYASERKRKWRIYLLDLKSYKEMILFSSKGLNLVGGTSVKDSIAFSSSKDGSSEIYTINIYGKKLKKLTRSFGIDVSPVFSPDGSRIAFVSDRGGTPQIYTMKADGNMLRRLTFEGSYNTSPSWSQDGKWIAYVGRKDGKNQIFMVKSDGTDVRQLTFTGNNESPSFSPDGLYLAFDSDREGKQGVYIMNIHGERQKRVTPKNIKAVSPKWSPYLKK